MTFASPRLGAILLTPGLLVLALLTGAREAVALGDCSPNEPTGSIYAAPDSSRIHPNWREGEVGTAWTLVGTSLVRRNGEEFFRGDLVDPRGRTVTRNVYVRTDEWSCDAD